MLVPSPNHLTHGTPLCNTQGPIYDKGMGTIASLPIGIAPHQTLGIIKQLQSFNEI